MSDLVGNGGSMRKIPEDLKQDYELTCDSLKKTLPDQNADRRVLGQIKYYIERIADLSAENERHMSDLLKTTKNLEAELNHVLELQAENARLKQPVTDEEWKEFCTSCAREESGFDFMYRNEVDALLASRSKEPKCICGYDARNNERDLNFDCRVHARSKEPKSGPCSVCGDSDGKGYCPIHNPEEPKGKRE